MKIFSIIFFILFSTFAFTATRIENEYKLLVPPSKIAEVWEYLSTIYPNLLKPGFKSQVSVEYFTDVYFDTPDYVLLKQESSLRRRIRRVPDNKNDVKNGLSLVQFKLSEGVNKQLSRNEIKFEVKEKMKGSHFGTAPDLLLRNSEKASYFKTLEKLGIQRKDLRSTLVLEQKRSRVYISFNGKPFATISLDEAHSDLLWMSEKFTELEIELNENLYTDSNVDERVLMQKESDEMKKVIETAFPFLKLDLTPKYNKMFNLLIEQRPWYPAYITLESWFH